MITLFPRVFRKTRPASPKHPAQKTPLPKKGESKLSTEGLGCEVQEFLACLTDMLHHFIRIDMELEASKVVGSKGGNVGEKDLEALERMVQKMQDTVDLQKCPEQAALKLDVGVLQRVLAKVSGKMVMCKTMRSADAEAAVMKSGANAKALLDQAPRSEAVCSDTPEDLSR